MANVKITDLTALSGALVDADLFEMVDDVAGTPASRKVTAAVMRDYTNMVYAAYSTDAGFTPAVNTLYGVDISGFTAARTATLPTTAAVGDLVGLVITATNTTVGRELLITAATSDTLNGVAGGTEWSRIWQVGEVVIMRCIVANSTWVVERDGRIAQKGLLRLSTASSGESPATETVYTDKSGAWTADANVGAVTSASNGRIYARRAGNYLVSGNGSNVNGLSANQYYAIFCRKNGATRMGTNLYVSPANGVITAVSLPLLLPLAAGDYTEQTYQTQAGSLGGAASATQYSTAHLSLEQL